MLTSLFLGVVKPDDVYDANKSRELSRAVDFCARGRLRRSPERRDAATYSSQKRSLACNKTVFSGLSRTPFYSKAPLPSVLSALTIEADWKRRQLRTTALRHYRSSRGRWISSARAPRLFFFVAFPFTTIDTEAEGLSRSLKCQSSLERANPDLLLLPPCRPSCHVRRGRRP